MQPTANGGSLRQQSEVKLLFDQNLSFKLCRELSDIFPASAQVRLVNLDRSADRDIWDYAGVHGFTIVSLDSDFAELAALRGAPPKVIWMRIGNQPTSRIAAALRKHAETITLFLQQEAGACLELYD
jgi:predicted nuclease of predicted toxin-antitoxin system